MKNNNQRIDITKKGGDDMNTIWVNRTKGSHLLTITVNGVKYLCNLDKIVREQGNQVTYAAWEYKSKEQLRIEELEKELAELKAKNAKEVK